MNYSKLMAWFIIIIMALSVLGYVGGSFFSKEEQLLDYNGYKLYHINNQWTITLNSIKYSFQYSPLELEELEFPTSFDIKSISKVYLGYNSNDTFKVENYINVLARVIYNQGKIIQQACTTEEGCPNIPIIDCVNNIGIIIVSGEENNYTLEGKCLRITAVDEVELLKLTERTIYSLLGVM